MEDEEIPQLEEASVADASSPGAGQSRPLERRKVPITLLTGYLGAGKSTLLE
jgi:predicted ATPase